MLDVLRDAVANGELPPDSSPEILADALVGVLLLRRLMLHDPLDPAQAATLVDQLLPGPPSTKARS